MLQQYSKTDALIPAIPFVHAQSSNLEEKKVASWLC